jgi:hypothetical protein
MCDTHAELRPYADYICVNATAGRQVEQVGPFLATFSAHTANPFLSYAIPVEGAVPTDGDVRALVRAFEARGRLPRLKYFPVLAPEVAARLEAADFTLERRIPLMVCVPGALRAVLYPSGVAVRFPASDVEYLGAASAQRDAYRDIYEELEPVRPEDGASPAAAGRARRHRGRGGWVGQIHRELATLTENEQLERSLTPAPLPSPLSFRSPIIFIM